MLVLLALWATLSARASTPPAMLYKKDGAWVSLGSFGDRQYCDGKIPAENGKVTIYCRYVSDVATPNQNPSDPILHAVYPCLNGKIHGLVKIVGCHFGHPTEEPYKHGLRDGKLKSFYPGGKIRTEQSYLADQLDGPSLEYLEDGRVSHQSAYRKGQLEGQSIYFNPHTEVTTTQYYRNGTPVGPAQYSAPHPQEKLIAAAGAGDVAEVEKLLRAGAKPNLPGEKSSRENAVIVAAEFGKLEVLKTLLKAGGDPNSFDQHKIKTPLSAGMSHPEIIEYLVKNGADPDQRFYEGNTALHRAAQYGYLQTVELLLAHQANSRIKNDQGKTAADLVSPSGPQREQILARLKKPESSGQAVMDRKFEDCRKKAKAIARYIQVERAAWEKHFADCDAKSMSPEDLNEGLLMAAQIGLPEVLSSLLKRGAHINTTETHTYRSTPLMLAAREGKLEAVRFLLNHQAKIDLQDQMGKTALMYAVQWSGSREITELLLKSGARQDLKENDQHTALDLAKMKRRPELIDLLTKKH